MLEPCLLQPCFHVAGPRRSADIYSISIIIIIIIIITIIIIVIIISSSSIELKNGPRRSAVRSAAMLTDVQTPLLRKQTNIYIYIYVYMYIYTHVYTIYTTCGCVYTYIYIYTHTLWCPLKLGRNRVTAYVTCSGESNCF